MKTAIVLGMRSGTSLMAHILHTWGVKMGTDFQGGNKYNRDGYYEDLPLSFLIKDIIGNRFERTEQVQYIGVWQLKDLKDALELRFADMWGFKIPDSVFILDLIDMLVPNPHYILCMRDIKDMSRSLEEVEGHEYPKHFKHLDYCIKFQDLMLDGTRGKERIEFDYDRVVRYPVEELTALKEFLGLRIDNNLFDKGVALVNPKLRHHASNL